MHRRSGQLSLADGLVAARGGNRRLERIDRLLDWSELATLVGSIHGSPTGRPGYPPLTMVKALPRTTIRPGATPASGCAPARANGTTARRPTPASA